MIYSNIFMYSLRYGRVWDLSPLVEVEPLVAGGDEGDGCEAVLLLVLPPLVQGLDRDAPLGQPGTVSSRLQSSVNYRLYEVMIWSIV